MTPLAGSIWPLGPAHRSWIKHPEASSRLAASGVVPSLPVKTTSVPVLQLIAADVHGDPRLVKRSATSSLVLMGQGGARVFGFIRMTDGNGLRVDEPLDYQSHRNSGIRLST
jgi:hypothetical protein